MKLVVDTHLHIYPFYEIERALSSILRNLRDISPDAVKVACLTERYDCNIFEDLTQRPPPSVTAVFDIKLEGDSTLHITSKQTGEACYILPGQQIITSENIEILALNSARRVEEGKSATQTVTAVLECGGIPVVAWSPGKWFAKRGEVINQLIETFEPDQFALGDTTLRPYGWLTPLLMKKARNKGFKIFCGSDPLPFSGEENKPGCYASVIEIANQDLSPSSAIGGILQRQDKIESAGRRGLLPEVVLRILKNHRASKITKSSPHTTNYSMLESFQSFSGKLVLVTGATGFTGRILTRKLIQSGAIVRAIARGSSHLGDLESLDIDWYRGDVFDPELATKAAKGVQYIFHLAAAFREVKSTEQDYRMVHLESTKLLANAVLGEESFERFVHVSTVGVHGHIDQGKADESYRFAPGDEYQRTKLEGEQWITEFAEQNGLPYSVVRPSPIFGPGDERLLKLFKMVNKGYFLMLGKGRGMYHLIHVDDLTNILLLTAITPQAQSEVFIAANDSSIAMVDMSKAIAKSIGKRVKIIRLPISPFYLAADICEAICPKLGIQPPIYRRRVDFYTKDRQFDNSKVKRVLNYQLSYDNYSGIQETAGWYMENGLLD